VVGSEEPDKKEVQPKLDPGSSKTVMSATDLEKITTPPVESVSELIDLVDLFPPDGKKRWAFRGQPRNFGTLAPSFPRQFSRQSVGTAEIIERRLITAFREHYVELPDRSADMPGAGQIDVDHDLRCLSVMQHYEIPTRLLDWSSNFWTSIYFACASEPASQAELWCYDRSIFEAQRVGSPEFVTLIDHSNNPPPEPHFLGRRYEGLIIELDPQISPRMKKQEAHHTVSSDAFGDHAPLIFALQEKYPWATDGEGFRRVLISGSCKGKALQFLAEQMNITASTIFPDVVGLGRFLRWQFESLRTMLM
jgi:hypothetical protein